MLGNVSEWTSSPASLYVGRRISPQFKNSFVVRGLNFKAEKEFFEKPLLMLTTRNFLEADKEFENIGFRLVCEP